MYGFDTDDYFSEDDDLDCSITDPDYQPKAPSKLSRNAKPGELEIEENNISSNLDTVISNRPSGLSETYNNANFCTEIKNGKEGYLVQNDKHLFKARYERCSPKDNVHFREIGSDQGRFFITKVYLNASLWKDLDEDRHCVEAAILWEIAKIKRLDVEEITHESRGQPPVPLENRKRKRNKKNWKQSVKKQKLNSGQEYTYKCAKTGQTKIRQARSV